MKEKEGQTMKQEERLDYLVEAFKKDSVQYQMLKTGNLVGEKQTALRSLMNLRMPGAMKEEVLQIQDEYLKKRALEKGIVELDMIGTVADGQGSSHPYASKLSIWQGDITRLHVGAIVNAANSQMLGCFVPVHACIDNCIHTFAGIQLREACNQYMERKKLQYGSEYEEPTGGAMLTSAYNLPCDYVIHTVGPIVYDKLTDALRDDLRSCYLSILRCCVDNQIRSVAFCCISTGVFRFPNEEAAKIAVDTTTKFLTENEDKFDRIIFNVFKEIDREYYENLLG